MTANLQRLDCLSEYSIASICDHTFLNVSEAYREKAKEGESPVRLREKDFKRFLEETVNSKLIPYAVCIRPEDVSTVKEYLSVCRKKSIKIASVVGFPDGNIYSTNFKVAETKLAIDAGADEIDMVLNYDALKKGNTAYVASELDSIVKVVHDNNKLLKLILETSELDHDQIVQACILADKAGIDFVKTSTGFSAYGAKPDDLRVMRKHFKRGVKISGGVGVNNMILLLEAASGRDDKYIDLSPLSIRIGESSLLKKLNSVLVDNHRTETY